MRRKLKRDSIVFIAIFGLLTIPFLIFDLDISLQNPYYNSVQGWFLAKVPFWDFLYRYGIFLGYFMVIIALAIVSVSYWKKSVVKWRKASYFMLFVMVLGPGVLVNATFKDHWGRPRPREVKQFDGTETHIKPWVKGEGKGKSFPCGHASMGFLISIPFLFLRKRYKTWAWVFFIFGTLYGLLIGYARMIAGGHFASDVLWSAGMVWFAGIVGYYLLKVYNDIDEDAIDETSQRKKGKIVAVIMGLVVPILTVSLLLATPYISKKEFRKGKTELDALGINSLVIDIPDGTINVSFTEDLSMNYSVAAFGFPNSRVNIHWDEINNNSNLSIKYLGWFTEVRNSINISYPVNCQWNNNLNIVEGKVFIEIPSDSIPKNLNLNIQEGDVILYVTSESNFILTTNNIEIHNNSSVEFTNNNSAFVLNVNIADGELVIENR